MGIVKLDFIRVLCHSESHGLVYYGEDVSCQSKVSCIAAPSRGFGACPQKNFKIFMF